MRSEHTHTHAHTRSCMSVYICMWNLSQVIFKQIIVVGMRFLFDWPHWKRCPASAAAAAAAALSAALARAVIICTHRAAAAALCLHKLLATATAERYSLFCLLALFFVLCFKALLRSMFENIISCMCMCVFKCVCSAALLALNLVSSSNLKHNFVFC